MWDHDRLAVLLLWMCFLLGFSLAGLLALTIRMARQDARALLRELERLLNSGDNGENGEDRD